MNSSVNCGIVYIDPPFASGADYAKKVYIRRNTKVAEVIASAEQEIDIEELKAFEEKIYGENCFKNEIIWKRKQGNLGQTNQYGIVTDAIFYYTKSESYTFTTPLIKDGDERVWII